MSKYKSPGRRETSRTATINAAMLIPGRFKPDGCLRPIMTGSGAAAKISHYVQVNRKYRRSGGAASY